MTDLVLNQTLEVAGEWWLPNEPVNLVPGTLKYSSEGIELSLIRSFRELPKVIRASDEPHRYGVVHGNTSDGRAITLMEAYQAGRSFYFGSAGLAQPEKLRASKLLVGAHLRADQRLPKLTFRFPKLEIWIGEPTVVQRWEEDPEGSRFISFEVRKPVKRAVSVAAIDGQLTFQSSSAVSSNPFKVNVSSGGWITVSPNSPQTIDWLLEQSWSIGSMLSFLTGIPMATDCVKYLEREVEISLLYPARPLAPSTATTPHDLFLSLPDLGHSWSDVVANWFDKYSRLKAPSDLTASVLSSQGLWVHVEFLSLLQALEGLHRALYPGEYVSTEQYEEIRSALVGAIPQRTADDHKAALRSRIKYGYQYSLRRRLDQLAKSLTKELAHLVLGPGGKVPGEWIDTRNFYTHWDEELRAAILDNQELYFVNRRLRHFLRVLFVLQMGVSSETVLARLSGSSDAAQELAFLNTRDSRRQGLPAGDDTLMRVHREQGDQGEVAPRAPREDSDRDSRLLRALANPKWDYRTVGGLSAETGISEEEVLLFLERRRDLIRESLVPSREGLRLFALRTQLGFAANVWKSAQLISSEKL